jgi:CBS domain-containing protein
MKMEEMKQKKIRWLRESFEENTEPFILDANTLITEAAEKLLENRYRILAVIEQGKVVGVLTRTDITRSVAKLDHIPLTAQTNVRVVANQNFVRVLDDDNIGRLIDTLVEKKLDHIIICDNNDRLVGIVSRRKLGIEIEKLIS